MSTCQFIPIPPIPWSDREYRLHDDFIGDVLNLTPSPSRLYRNTSSSGTSTTYTVPTTNTISNSISSSSYNVNTINNTKRMIEESMYEKEKEYRMWASNEYIMREYENFLAKKYASEYQFIPINSGPTKFPPLKPLKSAEPTQLELF